MKNKTTFIKAMLFNRPVKVVKVDTHAEDFCLQLSNFRSEFKRIAGNHNQAVKGLNAALSEKQAQVFLYNIQAEYQKMTAVSTQIVNLT